MIEDNTLVIVRNRNAGSTRYMLDNGVCRHIKYNEVKKVPFGELKTAMNYKGEGTINLVAFYPYAESVE